MGRLDTPPPTRQADDTAGEPRPSGALSAWLRIASDASPLIAGPLLFLGGALQLLSAALPQFSERLQQISRWAPLGLIEVSHLLGSLIGSLMLFLAYGVSRRMAMARIGAIFLTLSGAAFALLFGAHRLESLYLLTLCVLFVVTRDAYWRQSRLSSLRPDMQWLVSACLAIAVGGWIGLLAYEAAPYSDELWWSFMLEGDLSRYLRAGLVVIAATTVIVIWSLGRPAKPDLPYPIATEHSAWLERALSASPETRLALMGDKQMFWSPSRASCLAFAARGNSWIAMGGGAGDPADFEELVWNFRSEADRRNAWVALYGLRAGDIAPVLAVGLSVRKIGETAVVPLTAFYLEGGARSSLRQAVRRGEREGLTFEVHQSLDDEGLAADLERISAHWLTERGANEKAFSLGRFDREFLRHCPVILARQAGRPVAFLTLLADRPGGRVMVDLMRYGAEAPEGAMLWLFIQTALWAKQEGWQELDLGMAPLAGLADRRFAPLLTRIGALVYQRAGAVYGFEGLRRFKNKLQPVWEPVYMAAPPGARMILALLRVALLTSGGWRGLLLRGRPRD